MFRLSKSVLNTKQRNKNEDERNFILLQISRHTFNKRKRKSTRNLLNTKLNLSKSFFLDFSYEKLFTSSSKLNNFCSTIFKVYLSTTMELYCPLFFYRLVLSNATL